MTAPASKSVRLVTSDDLFESCFEELHVVTCIHSYCGLQNEVGVGDKRVPTVANNQNRGRLVLTGQVMSLYVPRRRIGGRSLQIKRDLGLAHKESELVHVFERLLTGIL